ncbi:RNA polymerase sigma factor [Phycisphaerae bacterium RAS1]|nr:RNA polymerase sigma factor [Phycisphaerae bacterium RAS1]
MSPTPNLIDPKVVPYHGPAELEESWRQFVQTYTHQGTSAYNARNAALLNAVAFGDGGAAALTREYSGDPDGLTRLRRNVEDAILTLGNLTERLAPMRLLHKTIVTSLLDQWVDVRTQHGVYASPTGPGLTETEHSALAASAAAAIKSPVGGLLAGSLRMAFDRILGAELHRLRVRGRDDEERVPVLVEDVFHRTLFSYDPSRGAQFGSFLTGGIRNFVQQKLRQLKGAARVQRNTVYSVNWTAADRAAAQPPDARICVTEDIERLRQMLDSLEPLSRRILELRFGLADGIEHTYKDIGAKLGITLQNAQQRVERALSRCREHTGAGTSGPGNSR